MNPIRTKLPRPMLGADIDVDAVAGGGDVFHPTRALRAVERQRRNGSSFHRVFEDSMNRSKTNRQPKTTESSILPHLRHVSPILVVGHQFNFLHFAEQSQPSLRSDVVSGLQTLPVCSNAIRHVSTRARISWADSTTVVIGMLCPSVFNRSSHPSGFVQTSHTATCVLPRFDFLIVKPSASRSGTPVQVC